MLWSHASSLTVKGLLAESGWNQQMLMDTSDNGLSAEVKDCLIYVDVMCSGLFCLPSLLLSLSLPCLPTPSLPEHNWAELTLRWGGGGDKWGRKWRERRMACRLHAGNGKVYFFSLGGLLLYGWGNKIKLVG